MIALLLPSCFLFHKPKALLSPAVPPGSVLVKDRQLDELSGIVASPDQPGIFYVHNDSGDSSRFFAIGADGVLRSVFSFKGDAALSLGVKDVEDIAMGPGPDKNANYIYLGDIGDNSARRKYITIYRVKEPVVGAQHAAAATPKNASAVRPQSAAGEMAPPALRTVVDAAPLYLRYPDGPRDAETLLADPVDRLLYIISKREDSVGVYSTSLDFKPGDTVMLTFHTRLFFPGEARDKWITAGDISHSGDEILLKNYTGVFYWRRRYEPVGYTATAPENIWQTLQRPPVIEPYMPEEQGEAITFSPDGKGFYTISEGRRPKLYHYPLPGK